jgi:hypothetical protein
MASHLLNSGGSDDARGPWVAARTPRRAGYRSLADCAKNVSGLLTLHASARDEPVICRLRGRELISIDCYLIQMLGWHWTCTNGCSCWSPDEENRLRFFLTHGCALRTELGASGCSVVRRRDKGRDPDGRPAHWHSSAYSTTVIPIDASSTGQRLPHQVAPAPPHRHAPGPHTVGFGFRPCRRTGAPAREPDGTRPQV